MPSTQDITDALKELASPQYQAGMVRFGINNNKALGVKIPDLRKLARMIKKDHQLALDLWDTDIHEARILATMIADPVKLTTVQMDRWTDQFTSWDVCDQACGNLFCQSPYAVEKLLHYTISEHEFVKRAGFVLMAQLAVHQKKIANEVFLSFIPIIEREAWDERNFVKKAVNWALRQIGKRNQELRIAAIACAERMMTQDRGPARWIAKDALRELMPR